MCLRAAEGGVLGLEGLGLDAGTQAVLDFGVCQKAIEVLRRFHGCQAGIPTPRAKLEATAVEMIA